jgi:uncharacterized membrane protein
VQIAAIVALLGALLSLVSLIGSPAVTVVGDSTNPSATAIRITAQGLYLLVAVSAAAIAFTLVELYFFRRAFRALASQDRRFSTPASLTLLVLVAILIVALVGGGLISELYQSIQCAGPGNPITSTCLNLGNFLGLFALLGLAGILALIGYLGLLVGIWRLGSRYGESMFKIGAILLLIPLLNFVGVILILVAARSARGRIAAGGPVASFG